MRRQLLFLILCLVLMVSGCGQKEKTEVPADVIPHEQMVDIVVEAWFMESVIHNTIKEYEKLNDVTVTMYDNFFKEHGISKEQFVHSIEYYMRDNEEAQAFIAECSQRFEERKDEFTGGANRVSQPQ